MQFRDAKQGYPVYLLNKQEMSLSTGKVVSIGLPHFEPSTPSGPQTVVDLLIESNGRSTTYSLPENYTVAYAGNLVVALDKPSLANAVEAIRTAAKQHIEETPHQQEVFDKATALMGELNPEIRERQAQETRLASMEKSIEALLKSAQQQQILSETLTKNMQQQQSSIDSLVKTLKR